MPCSERASLSACQPPASERKRSVMGIIARGTSARAWKGWSRQAGRLHDFPAAGTAAPLLKQFRDHCLFLLQLRDRRIDLHAAEVADWHPLRHFPRAVLSRANRE